MKVLYVERAAFWQNQLAWSLPEGFEVLTAQNLARARRLFVDNHDIDAVVVSDQLEHELDTLEFVAEICRGFSGVILACCSNCNNGDQLVKAGCHEQVIKSHLAQKLLQLAGLEAEPVAC